MKKWGGDEKKGEEDKEKLFLCRVHELFRKPSIHRNLLHPDDFRLIGMI
jgi:hypothetical protein